MESIEILQQSKGIVQRNRQRCQQNDKRSLRDQKMHRNIMATHLWKIKEKQSLIQKAKLAYCHLLSRYYFQNISQSE